MFSYWVKTPRWLKLLYPKSMIWDIPVAGHDTVYITFDDGPHPTITPFVMEQLKEYGAKGTFFCVGNNVTKFPAAYGQLLQNGHKTGNHTYNHLNGWKTADDEYLRNIALASEYIHSNLFRPPYGRIRLRQLRAMKKTNPYWKICMWDVLSADFDRSITPQQCLDNVLKNIRPGSIVLFHDSEKAWERMSYALPKVLEHCKSKNWQMQVIEG